MSRDLNDPEPLVGPDFVSFLYKEEVYSGYFKESPLRERMLHSFGLYDFSIDPLNTFRARWSLSEGHLQLMYVNARINGIKLYTNDLVTGYPDDTVFYSYLQFSGALTMLVDLDQTWLPFFSGNEEGPFIDIKVRKGQLMSPLNCFDY